MAASDDIRLSVVIVDVQAGREAEFLAVSERIKDELRRKEYCTQVEAIRDEGVPSCFYLVRHWVNADAARRSHADPAINELQNELHRVGLVTHAINGTRDQAQIGVDERRVVPLERDRRAGLDRRVRASGSAGAERRRGLERRIGPRRDLEQTTDLVGAARRARENADAAFSHFKVGAAIETTEGIIVTGCNIENATYGLTVCAERVAMFKALSDGHRGFRRIAIVADTESPTPPCGACRQILWEFGGNLEVRLANLTSEQGTHWLKDLLPFPFDARLLGAE